MTSRGRVIAETALSKLLNRAERTPNSERTIRERLPVGALLSDEREERDALLAAAVRIHAVRLVPGKKEWASETEYVELVDPAPLYILLGRQPAAVKAEGALALIQQRVDVTPPWSEFLDTIVTGWRVGGRPHGLGPEDAEDIAVAVTVARELAGGRWNGYDMRTVSAKTAGQSKWLESHVAVVAQLLRFAQLVPSELSAEDAIKHLGVAKFPHPCLISGPVALDDQPMLARPYTGIAPDNLTRLTLTADPHYILTIENFASFNRYVRELPCDDAIVIYTGGFPSSSLLGAYAALTNACAAPVFHWGDIDVAGLWIAEQLARRSPRALKLHLMSQNLAAKYGVPGPPEPTDTRWSTQELAVLADFLGTGGACRLEQENLDPAPPAFYSQPKIFSCGKSSVE